MKVVCGNRKAKRGKVYKCVSRICMDSRPKP